MVQFMHVLQYFSINMALPIQKTKKKYICRSELHLKPSTVSTYTTAMRSDKNRR
jgi:hypothetical protein